MTMQVCYYCGAPKKSREHLPPQHLFKGFPVDCIKVPSCEKHNTGKGDDDNVIIKSMLMALDKSNLPLNEDVKSALQIVKPHFEQAKNKLSERTLYKRKNKNYDFVVLDPKVDLSDWIRKLSAGLIWYKTKFYDKNNQFDNSIVFEKNSYPTYETPQDLSIYERNYMRKIEIAKKYEDGNWINGWNDKKNTYPETIYFFCYRLDGERIIIKHKFYQQFTYYNVIVLSENTLMKFNIAKPVDSE
jgi:hypothetical protein